MQTEKAKSSHFDRTRGHKNQIFPTLATSGHNKYYEESLVSSNSNSKQVRFHGAHPNVDATSKMI